MRRSWLALALGGAALATAFIAGERSSALSEIRRLPGPDRARIFGRAFEDLRATCSGTRAAGALLQHCREQARFVMLFPECDGGCHRFTVGLLPHAAR